jgi:hypothetical protein
VNGLKRENSAEKSDNRNSRVQGKSVVCTGVMTAPS